MNTRKALWAMSSGSSKLLGGISIFCSLVWGQQMTVRWQDEVQRYTTAHDWTAAMRIVDREIGRAPGDLDVRAWRARILMWSGQLVEAEREYLEILTVASNDPDNWLGLGTVYSREGKTEEALRALDWAVELDPRRADLHTARGRVLRTANHEKAAKLEFQKALELDPRSTEAHSGLLSLRGESKHELRVGVNTDLLSFANPNHDQGVSLSSQWTPHWRTSVAGDLYQRAGTDARKFEASLTGKLSRWGAFTAGGATARDNAVIPKGEAFFDYEHGWRLRESGLARGLEIVYGQHWYWYTTARILTINGTTIFYLPHEWTWSLGLIEARSHFSGTGAEWRPSGATKIGFPVARWDERRFSGNVFFASGTENFAQLDQIGRFSSQTYGGGLRFQFAARQDLTGFAAYQKRTQDRTQTSFGFSYGIRF
jgi:tetratricopeptide (TPR) repeat protein